MSKDPIHGGGTWAFSNCVWAPTKTRDGKRWPFWNKIAEVRDGDLVFHLRTIASRWSFVGYSTALGNGIETNTRPPQPGEWDYSEKFYRADLSDFTPFYESIHLNELFSSRRLELEQYLVHNNARHADKKRVFYIKQGGRLQCLNGAYLSEVEDELLTALFGSEGELVDHTSGTIVISVPTSSQFSTVRSRRGQKTFSDEIKKAYAYQCCFPGCPVSDVRFLVAAHIARWCDNEALRGHIANGLCFCILHDKAFELGAFTLDAQFRILINPKERETNSWLLRELAAFHGKGISLADIPPSIDALMEHWNRVGIKP